MKIAFFSHNAHREGAPLSLLSLAIGMRRRGHTCFLIAPHNGPMLELSNAAGISSTVIPNCFNGSPYHNPVQPFIQLEGIDCVVVNTVVGFALVLFLRQSFPQLRILWIIRESERDTYEEMYPDLRGECFAAADHVVFVADATRQIYGDLDTGNFRTIHNGIDVAAIERYKITSDKRKLRQKFGLPRDATVLSLFGMFCPRKGQAEFVHSVVRLINSVPEKKIHALLVGRTESAEEHRYMRSTMAYAEKHGMQDRFHLIPETPTIFPFYRMTDIFCCPSFVESFPRVILEAMAFGLPIVASDIYGIGEQIEHRSHGLLTLPGTFLQLVPAIMELIRDPALAAHLGRNGSERVRTMFTENMMLNKYEHIIFPQS